MSCPECTRHARELLETLVLLGDLRESLLNQEREFLLERDKILDELERVSLERNLLKDYCTQKINIERVPPSDAEMIRSGRMTAVDLKKIDDLIDPTTTPTNYSIDDIDWNNPNPWKDTK